MPNEVDIVYANNKRVIWAGLEVSFISTLYSINTNVHAKR